MQCLASVVWHDGCHLGADAPSLRRRHCLRRSSSLKALEPRSGGLRTFLGARSFIIQAALSLSCARVSSAGGSTPRSTVHSRSGDCQVVTSLICTRSAIQADQSADFAHAGVAASQRDIFAINMAPMDTSILLSDDHVGSFARSTSTQAAGDSAGVTRHRSVRR